MKYRPHIEARWRDRWENEARIRHSEYLAKVEALRRLKLADTVLTGSLLVNIALLVLMAVNKYLRF